MSRQIKVGADTSEIKKSISELSNMLKKDMGKSKIELFSPETKKLLRGEAIAQAEKLKKQIDAIKNSTKEHHKALENVIKGSKEELKLKEKILKAAQRITETERSRTKIASMSEELAPSKNGFMGGLSKALSKIPMLGKVGAMGGMGALGGAGMLAGGALVGAGAYGLSRVMAARETYGAGVESKLKLRGRGVSDLNPTDSRGMLGAGLNSISLRQARLRDMDVFGSSGATQKSVIGRAKFERNYGVEEGTLSGIGAGFRSSMGGNNANVTLMKLQASLMASGIKDAIGPYLETAANMLTELNEKGFTLDDSVTSLFNSVLKTGMGEGHAKGLMTGVDSGIRGATGESSAFFQNIFNKQGIGGGTIGGAQAAMRMGGLFGVDLDKYKLMGGTDRKAFQTLGIGGANHMKNVAGGTLNQLDTMFGSEGSINKMMGSKDQATKQGGALKRLSRLRYVMSSFGLKNEGQASEVEGLLKKASTASPQEQKNIMKKIQDIKENTPELDNLKKINSSTEGIYDQLKNEKTTLEEAIGEATADAFNKMNSFLRSIDEAILAIAKFFGYSDTSTETIKGEINAKQNKTAQGLLSGTMPAGGQMSDLRGMGLKDQMKLYGQLKDKAKEEEGKGLFRNHLYEMAMNDDAFKESRRMYAKGKTSFEPPTVGRTDKSGNTLTEPNQLVDAIKQQTKVTKEIAKHVGVTAKNSKEKGTLKAASGSTTGQ